MYPVLDLCTGTAALPIMLTMYTTQYTTVLPTPDAPPVLCVLLQ